MGEERQFGFTFPLSSAVIFVRDGIRCIILLVLSINAVHSCTLPFGMHYRDADKSLAQPTSRCILFDGENISLDASLVIYIYIYIYIYI